MYELIASKKTVRALYAEQLALKNRLPAEASKQLYDSCVAEFISAVSKSKSERLVKDPPHLEGKWAKYRGGLDKDTPQVETGVALADLKKLLKILAMSPEGFTLHPNVQKGLIDKRQKMRPGVLEAG